MRIRPVFAAMGLLLAAPGIARAETAQPPQGCALPPPIPPTASSACVPPPPTPARLGISRVEIRHGALLLDGTISPHADGFSAWVSLHARDGRFSLHSRIRDGRLHVDEQLPPPLRRDRDGRLWIAYRGDGGLLAVRFELHAARRQAGIEIERARRHGRRLAVAGTISDHARGTVRLMLRPHPSWGADGRPWQGRARIRHGRWHLDVDLPRRLRHHGDTLAVTYPGRRGIAGARVVRPLK